MSRFNEPIELMGAPGSPYTRKMLALVVTDIDAEHDRLVTAGVPLLKQVVTEPWGQRRMQVAGPDGLVIELGPARRAGPRLDGRPGAAHLTHCSWAPGPSGRCATRCHSAPRPMNGSWSHSASSRRSSAAK